MTRSRFAKTRLVCAGAGVSLLLLALLWRGGDPESARRAKRLPAAPGAPGSGGYQTYGEERPPLPERGTKEFTAWTLEHCGPWLEGRGRDAAGLVAMWDLTEEESLLWEAAGKYPDDPRVCAAMIGYLTAKKQPALEWAERLTAAEPANPAAHYRKATLLAKEEKPAEALAALRAGTEAEGAPDAHLKARLATVREAVLAGGGDVRDAARAALAGLRPKSADSALGAEILFTTAAEVKAAKDAGDEDRVADLSGLTAMAAEHLLREGEPSLADELMLRAILMRALKDLPPNTEYGDGTAGRRRLEMQERQNTATRRMGDWGDPDDFLDRLTNAQVTEYMDRVIRRGEGEAAQWLESVLPPAPEEDGAE